MKLRSRKGFTLAELLIAVLIFGFMITSLATIYATANKHMFQQYRTNTVKSGASVAMKTIVNNLMAANRIDAPAPNASGNILAFAVNVDQNSGCYPISTLATAPFTPTCHYFCLSGGFLYHHTTPITAVPPGCPSPVTCSTCFTQISTPGYPAFCGPGGGGTVTKLGAVTQVLGIVDPNASGLFSRRTVDGIYEADQVKVMLRVNWDPADMATPGVDLRTSGRKIDATLTSTVKINRSVN
ncbi:MAG: type II secretion system GspH family protein [Elusimicrobia bacterium]|nr:type II secretion system GspH family protein [Elusimicrobiota bacterium]